MSKQKLKWFEFLLGIVFLISPFVYALTILIIPVDSGPYYTLILMMPFWFWSVSLLHIFEVWTVIFQKAMYRLFPHLKKIYAK